MNAQALPVIAIPEKADDLRLLLAELERRDAWTLEDACRWASAHGYVMCSRDAISAFAKAAHVEVTFDAMGGVVVGRETK